MDARELLVDEFDRIRELYVDVAGTSVDLHERPSGTGNPIAWLLWHTARVQDDHVAGVAGVAQAWDGFSSRFGLPFPEGDIGYGHTSDEVSAVRIADPSVLVEYHAAVHQLTLAYLSRVTSGGARPRRRPALGPARDRRCPPGQRRRRLPPAPRPGRLRPGPPHPLTPSRLPAEVCVLACRGACSCAPRCDFLRSSGYPQIVVQGFSGMSGLPTVVVSRSGARSREGVVDGRTTRGRRGALRAAARARGLLRRGFGGIADGSRAAALPPSPSPSATGPALPVDAKARTGAGAKAFARHWVASLNYASATGDTGALEAVSAPGCETCANTSR